jgi:hypothetical protein
MEAFTRDLFSRAHPGCGPERISIVEDVRAGRIVSSMCVLEQTWRYAGIAFGVGEMGAVSTDAEYRRRGLVRAQFERWHRYCAARGVLVQAIAGIPWYYRQFGYEYALALDGGRVLFCADLPGTTRSDEAHHLRRMTTADLSWVMPLYMRDSARSLIACERTEAAWTYLLTGMTSNSTEYRDYQVIERADGTPRGYVAVADEAQHGRLRVTEFVVDAGESLRAIAPLVLHSLAVASSPERIYLCLGRSHPVYRAIPDLLRESVTPYAWYMRVADAPGFVRHIAPALEARLADSPLAGYSGVLPINEYRGGFRMGFERGALTLIERFQPPQRVEGAGFPPLVFLQLLFGYRSLAELRASFPDCVVRAEAAVLLDVLFPRCESQVIAIH